LADNLPAPIHPTSFANSMRLHHLATIGTDHQDGDRKILMTTAVAALMTRYFFSRYSTHELSLL